MFIKADTLMAYRVIKNDTVISQPKPPLPADTAIDSIAHDSISHDSISHDSIPYDSIAHDSIAHDSIPHDSIPHDSISANRAASFIAPPDRTTSASLADTTIAVILDTAVVVDTSYRMHAFYHVKFFHKQVQGACDSMSYSTVDSLTEMFYDPVLWNSDNQLSAEKMEIFQHNNQLNRLEMIEAGFIASIDDSVKKFFNQIRGKLVVAHFADNDLYRVNVFGSGQTLYFLRDSLLLVGVNKSAGTDIVIDVEKRQVKKIKYTVSTDGNTVPPLKLKIDEFNLKGLKWQKERRPISRFDITTRPLRPSQRQAAKGIEQPQFEITTRIDGIKNAFFPPSYLLEKPET
jgi:hypothetical protein